MNAALAADKEASVTRLVVTSSEVAIANPVSDADTVYSMNNWNEESVEAAWQPPPYEPERAWVVYAASKTQSEQKLWEYYKEKKPGFALNTIIPGANFGPKFNVEQPEVTGGWPKAVYRGDIEAVKLLPPGWMVDVRDTAKIHVAALLNPEVTDERILAFAHPFNWNDMLAAFRKLFPEKTFSDDISDLGRDLRKIDNSRGLYLLQSLGQSDWTSFEQSIFENVTGP